MLGHSFVVPLDERCIRIKMIEQGENLPPGSHIDFDNGIVPNNDTSSAGACPTTRHFDTMD